MTCSGSLHVGLSFFCILICFFSSRAWKTQALSCLACKNFWMWCTSCHILQICHFLLRVSTQTGCMLFTTSNDQHCWQRHGGCVTGMHILYYCCLSKTITLTKPCRTSEDIQTVAGTSEWHGSHLQSRIIAQVWAQLHFWQSGQEPEGHDDRQTASWWYQHLPICLCIPQDIVRACGTAAFISSAQYGSWDYSCERKGNSLGIDQTGSQGRRFNTEGFKVVEN